MLGTGVGDNGLGAGDRGQDLHLVSAYHVNPHDARAHGIPQDAPAHDVDFIDFGHIDLLPHMLNAIYVYAPS